MWFLSGSAVTGGGFAGTMPVNHTIVP
jgi:hypothetical protein